MLLFIPMDAQPWTQRLNGADEIRVQTPRSDGDEEAVGQRHKETLSTTCVTHRGMGDLGAGRRRHTVGRSILGGWTHWPSIASLLTPLDAI